MNKVLGFRKFNSKTGKPFCILQTCKPFTDRELEYGACGQKIEEIWLPESCHAQVNPQVIGKVANITYNVQGGKAYVDSVSFE